MPNSREVVARTEALIPVLRERATAVDNLPRDAAGKRGRAGIGRHRTTVPSRRGFGGCEAGLVERRRCPGRRGTGLRLDRLVHGPARDAQLHAVALAQAGQRDIWGDDPTLLRERHLHPRLRPRAERQGRLRALGPLAADEWRQHQRLVPVGRPGRRRTAAGRTVTSPCRAAGADRRYLARGRPQGLGGRRRHHRRSSCAARGIAPVDRSTSRAAPLRQRDRHKSALSRSELLRLRGLYQRRPARHRRGRAQAAVSTVPATGSRWVSRQKVGKLPTEQVKVAGSLAARRRCAARLASAICDEAGRHRRPRRPAERRAAGRGSARTPHSPDAWRAAPSGCCGTPAPAAACTATIRCRVSIATSASRAARSPRTGTWTKLTHGRVLMGFELGDPTL